MAASTFTIAWDGQEETAIEDLNLDVSSRILRNRETDFVNIVTRKDNTGDDQIIPARTFVTLYKDGTKWFQGWSKNPSRGRMANGAAHLYKIRGPWHFLENAAYGYTPEFAPGVTLPPAADWIWSSIAAWSNGAMGDYFQLPTDWPGSFPDMRLAKLTLGPNSLAANIRELLAKLPTAALRFDYDGDIPAGQLLTRGDSVKTFAWGTSALADMNLRDDSDDAPRAMRLRYVLTTGLDTLTEEEIQELGRLRVTTGPDLDDERGAGTGLVHGWTGCHEWEKLTLYTGWESDLALTFATDPFGQQMADYILDQLGDLNWSGTMSFLDENCDTGIKPGDSINITGLHSDFTAMNALVQQVEEYPGSGQTKVTVGFPLGIDATSLYQLYRTALKWMRYGSMPTPPQVVTA